MLKNNLQYFLLGLILLVHAFLLTKLIFFPYPEFFVYPYLTNAGLKPYSQIMDQHFPGLMFLPVNFDNLGMNDEFSARIWLMVIVSITQLLIFFVSRVIFKNGKKALAVNLLYLIWQPFFEGWVLWIDTFLPLFLLPAFYLTYKTVRIDKVNFKLPFLLGLFLGLAIIFKQIVIPLAFLVFLYLLWEKRNLKIAANFLAGLLLPIGVMTYYFFSIGVLKDFWYWTVTFNLTTFARFGKKAPFFSGVARVGFATAFSFLAIFLKDKKLAQVLGIFIIGSLMAIYARFDFVHFQPALPFILITTVAGFSEIWKQKWARFILAGYLAVIVWWLSIFYSGHLSGKVMFFDAQTKEIANKIKQYTKAGDKIFIFGAVPHLYQMSKTLPAGDLFVFQFPWFVLVTEEKFLEGLKKDDPEIVVSDRTVEIEGQKITEFAKGLDEYILANYETIDSIGTTRIMRKRIE